MLIGTTAKVQPWHPSAAATVAAADRMAPCTFGKRRAMLGRSYVVAQASPIDSKNHSCSNNSPEPSSKMAMTRADLEACQWLRPSMIKEPQAFHSDMDHGDHSFATSDDSHSCRNGSAATHSSSSSPKHSSILVNTISSPLFTDAITFSSWQERAETGIERAIFNFRFLSLLAVAGSLAGSFLCFLKGCVFVVESYGTFYSMCLNGVHTGKMVLRLVEAVDVYLTGTVMFIFGMGLYGLFISNVANNLPPSEDRAIQNSSLFGMFYLQERPKWMRIGSLDELKTKLGHVVVMILLVKMFERSKAVMIATGTDLLSYSVSIFLTSAALLVLHKLHH